MALPELKSPERVLIAKKMFHKGMFFRAAAYGNTTMKLDDNFAIEVIKANGDFLTVNLYRYSMDATPATQSWQPPKAVRKEIAKKSVINKRELKVKPGVHEL